jgi:T-complex protein 1 subunit epsilon
VRLLWLYCSGVGGCSSGLTCKCVLCAENAGLSPITEVTSIKARQLAEGNPRLGVDCNQTGNNDMRDQLVFETLIGKQQQIQLATQVVKMVSS